MHAVYQTLCIGLAILAFCLMLTNHSRAEEIPAGGSLHVTDIHRAVTTQNTWLNTSRKLEAEDLKGRIILLDFWTYCCINCIHVIPELHSLETQFGNDLTVIGVHSAKFKNERDSENIRQAILRYDIRHPVVNDFDFTTWKSFGIRAWPSFVLINPLGMIEQTYYGEGNREKIARDINQLREHYAGRITTAALPIALEKDKTPPGVLSFPGKLAAGEMDGKLVIFVADSAHQRIAVMTPEGAIIDSIGSGTAGKADGDFEHASFNTPQGLAWKKPLLYIADTQNHMLRVADLSARSVTTLAGTGEQGSDRSVKNRPALETRLASPWDVALYPDDAHLVIAMAGLHQLWSYDLAAKTLSVIAGNGHESIDDGHYPANSLSQPSGLSAHDGKLYFVDSETSSLRAFEHGNVTTLIGTGLFDFGYKEGTRDSALMQHALGVLATDAGVYIADSYNHSIRIFNPKTGVLSNFAGHGVRGNNDGALKQSAFNEPNAIITLAGKLYVADTNNSAIRVIDPATKKVSTLAIRETPRAQAFADFSTNLPNLETHDAISVAEGAATPLTLTLAKGWHINADAPSGLTVYEMSATPKAIAGFTLDAIKKNTLMLPSLSAEKTYRLQGTLYYCEDKEGAQCLLKSFDIPLSARKDGMKAAALKVN